MPRQKGVTQLDTLRRKQAEIAEQLQAAEAREREKEKHADARRRELLGQLIADQLRAAPDSILAQTTIDLLNRKLTKAADRALFSHLLSPADVKETLHEPQPPPTGAPTQSE